jgi:hypothetical protein
MKLKTSLQSMVLALLMASSAFPTWRWGSEGITSCTWSQPVGLVKGKFFNYSCGWPTESQIKFFNWPSAKTFVAPGWCFEGAISTMMLYYQWPDATFLNGYWSSSSDAVRIEHNWGYSSLYNSNDATGNPSVEPLALPNIPGYSMGTNEIGRLYSTVRIATNYTGNYSPLFQNQRMYNTVKNDLGFTNASYILPTDPNLASTLQNQLNNGNPVIVVGGGHTWNLDKYSNGQYHVLDYENCTNFHRAYWVSNPTSEAGGYGVVYFIYNLNPLVTVPAYTSKTITFNYGDAYMLLTSGKTFTKRIRLFNNNTTLNNVFNVTLSDGSTTYYNNLSYRFINYNAELALPPFTFSVPAGGSKTLTLTITNSYSRDIGVKIIIDDVAPSSQPSFTPDRLADLMNIDATRAIQVTTSTGTGFSGNGSGTWVGSYGFGSLQNNYFPADFNGDGLTDLGYLDPSDSRGYSFWVSLSGGAGFGNPGSGQWVLPGNWGGSWGSYLVGDFSGDGKADYLFFQPGDMTFHVLTSTGTGFTTAGNGVWLTTTGSGFGPLTSNYFAADFNGDGKTDLGYLGSDGSFWVALSTGTSFQYPALWIVAGHGPGLDGSYYVGDFTGDHKADLLYFKPADNSIMVLVSTGSGFGGTGTGTWMGSNGFGSLKNNYFPADFNGDGLMDLGYLENNAFYVVLSTGTSFSWNPPAGCWISANGWVGTGGKYYVSNCLNRK